MDFRGKVTRIRLLSFNNPPMRAFDMTWFAFFLGFFAWFGIAPLMKVVREELALTPEQVGWTIIAAVAGVQPTEPIEAPAFVPGLVPASS